MGDEERGLDVPTEPVDLAAPPGTEEHDRAQEALMYEGATAASTESPEPTGTSPSADEAAREDPEEER